MSSKAISFVFAALALFPLTACETLQEQMYPPVETIVVLPESSGPSTQYLVRSSSTTACQQGVRDLDQQDFEKAVTSFKAALLGDAGDDNAHFGIAVAYERLGKYELAFEHYQAANRIPREPNSMYAASVERMRAKLGR